MSKREAEEEGEDGDCGDDDGDLLTLAGAACSVDSLTPTPTAVHIFMALLLIVHNWCTTALSISGSEPYALMYNPFATLVYISPRVHRRSC
jgi:hypothetical protein